MNPGLFKNSPAGQCVLTQQGYDAFVPNPLPPNLEVDWELASLLSEANAHLGELSGALTGKSELIERQEKILRIKKHD